MRIGIDIQVVAAGNRSGLYYHLRRLADHLRPLVDGKLWLLAEAAHDPLQSRTDKINASQALDGAAVTFIRQPYKPFKFKLWHWVSRVNRLDVLLHNLHGCLPRCTRGANAYVVPDVIPLAFDYKTPGFVDQYRSYYDTAVRHGDVIIVWSEHTKRDLLERVGGVADRIRVAPLAAGPEFRPESDRAALRRALAAHGLGDAPYVLCVSTLEMRKNHSVLIRAFARIVSRDPSLPHRLVFVGGKWKGYEAVFELVTELGLTDRLVYLGYADPLPPIYSGADAFVFPSVYEGFGLPPLEAMACGVPVLASNASSLPEVVGDAGVLFDTFDDVALADRLYQVLTDRAYHADLAARGLARAAQFSWHRTAEQYLDAFQVGLRNRAEHGIS